MSDKKVKESGNGLKHDPKRTQEEFEEFAREFKSESDRAAVILGASKLDQLLGMILERYLLPCPVSNDHLFDANGPLGNFSSKIDFAYRLGLINSQYCKSIHLIRRIRNAFAHEVYGAKLNNGSHRDRVKALVSPFVAHSWFLDIKKTYFNDEDEARAEFSSILSLMIVRLETRLNYIETVSDQGAIRIVPEEYNNENQSDA